MENYQLSLILIEFCSIGQLNEEEEVLQWLITQKTEDRIELITRQMLETMVEDTQYLAVYFCKLNHILPIKIEKLLFYSIEIAENYSEQ